MATILAPTTGATELMRAARIEAHSAGWVVSAREDVGTLPGCRLQRVTEHIQQNLDKELPIAELAAVVYMSPYHFARLFKRSTGVSPHRFVVRQRVRRACAWLAMPDLAIAKISRMVGFRTPSHFSTVFRRVVGITPRGYRTGSLQAGGPDPAGG
jgi:AraC family transcriptional regulator